MSDKSGRIKTLKIEGHEKLRLAWSYVGAGTVFQKFWKVLFLGGGGEMRDFGEIVGK